MSIKQNTTSLQSLLETLSNKAIGGVELPELINPASASDIISGKETIDKDGKVLTGSFNIDSELSTQDNLISQIQEAVNGLPEAGSGENAERVISITNDSSSNYSIYYLDESGKVQKASPGSTFNALYGIVFRAGMYSWICTGDYIASSLEQHNLAIFKADGGVIEVDESGSGGAE